MQACADLLASFNFLHHLSLVMHLIKTFEPRQSVLAFISIISGRISQDLRLVQVLTLVARVLTTRAMLIGSVDPLVPLVASFFFGHCNYVLGPVDALRGAHVGSLLFEWNAVCKHLVVQGCPDHWLGSPALWDRLHS